MGGNWSLADNLMVANTYSKILHQVATPALEHADIHFLEEVVRIANLPEKTEGNGEVIVETASGLRKTCNHVVVTAPHGWLRQNKASFVPPMPRQLSEATTALPIASLRKSSSTFPRHGGRGIKTAWAIQTDSPLKHFIQPRSTAPGESWAFESRDLLIFSPPV